MYNFFNVTGNVSRFRRGYLIDPYDEPTYLSFGIDFAFEGLDPLTIDSLWSSPLFKKSDKTGVSTNSAMTYLGMIGRNDMEGALEYFIDLLQYVSTKTPWYFQSISGLEKMHAAATDMTKAKKYDHVIEIDTLEAVDLRISRLANLYRAAIYDKEAMLARVPENLRWFSMDIWVAETRNIRFEVPGLAGNAANLLGINTSGLSKVATQVSSSLSGLGVGVDDLSSTIKQFGFVKFKCRQCEFDFSGSFAGGNKLDVGTPKSPNNNSFAIKVGYFEEESGYVDGSKLYDGPGLNKVKDPWMLKVMSELSRASDIVGGSAGLPFVGNLASKTVEATANALNGIGGLTNRVTDPISRSLYPPVKRIGDVYPDLQRPPSPNEIGNVYD